MIPKQEILKIASTNNLSAPVIEKDYVIGWLLWGINNHLDLKDNWVFKGGTCLKKCYFKDYRFSEDCDFTLKLSSQINTLFLKSVFTEIGETIYEASGIIIPDQRIFFKTYTNLRGNTSCEGRIYYQGPISPMAPQQLPTVRLDLTADEILVETPVIKEIFHQYSDCPSTDMKISCYSYIEIFAEKIRALAERTRPRDLYDVINLFHNSESKKFSQDIREVLIKKCKFKNIPIPTYDSIQNHKEQCKAGWQDQLSHQLPYLHKFEVYWNELDPFFLWLNNTAY